MRKEEIHKMKEINSMKMEFMSRSVNERFARSTAAAFISQLDPTLDELGDIKAVVSEAVTNSIVHAYPDKIGKILMKIRIFEKNVITVRDYGLGIEDVERAREPMFTTGGEDRSGMGFTIMESFTDSLKIKSSAGRGTTVTMKMRLSQRAGLR